MRSEKVHNVQLGLVQNGIYALEKISSSVQLKSASLGKAHNVQFSSGQEGMDALRKAHMRSTPFSRTFPQNVAFETVPMFV